MKAFYAFGFAVMFCVVSADNTCMMIPNVKVGSCCKQVELAEKKVIEDVYHELVAMNLSAFMLQCKLHENLLKKLNLVKDNGMDKDASIKYIDDKVHDSDWNKVLKSSLDFCIPKMAEKSAEFQKKIAIPQEICNVLFTGIILCMDISTFISCPAKSWIDAPGCPQAKEFTTKCVGDEEAMGKFVMMQ